MKAFIQELFRTGIYKRTQGRITRQVSFAAIAVCFVTGAVRLHETLVAWGGAWEWLTSMGASPRWWCEMLVFWAVPLAILLAGSWTAYRLVNVPAFADFLIAVEAEMNKVSWPTWHELIRGSTVVLIVIVGLAIVLFSYDSIWRTVFTRVLRIL